MFPQYPYSYPLEAYFHPSATQRVFTAPYCHSFVDTPELRARQNALVTSLIDNTLYVIPSLCPYDEFAWFLYFHISGVNGIKYFGVQVDGVWYLTARQTDNIFEIPWICMFIKIGTIADDRMEDFVDVMRYYRDNSHALSGRRSFDWCFQTIDLLSTGQIILCSDLARLQNRCVNAAQSVVSGIAHGRMSSVITAEQVSLYPPRYASWHM